MPKVKKSKKVKSSKKSSIPKSIINQVNKLLKLANKLSENINQ